MRPLGRPSLGVVGQVSILTRPEGRMRHRRRRGSARHSGFNPHPTRRPDAAGKLGIADAGIDVSILTRPEGRMRRLTRTAQAGPTSFNPHPTRRPDAAASSCKASRPTAFQSSPDPKAGCGGGGCAGGGSGRGFNPHPTRRPDAAILATGLDLGAGFQSSPDPKAGCGVIMTSHL